MTKKILPRRRKQSGVIAKPAAKTKLRSKTSVAKPQIDAGLLLSQTTTTVEESARGIVIVGQQGLGKSTFCSQFPDAIFIHDPHDGGIRDLVAKNVTVANIAPTVDHWDMLLELCMELATQDHPYRTAVFESLTGLERLCFEACCDAEYGGDWSKTGFMSFFAGPSTAAKEYWPLFLSMLDKIRERGVHVLITGHTEIKTKNNPTGADYDSEITYCDKRIWQCTHKWAEAVLMMALSVDVETKSGQEKGKANGEEIVMHCTPTAAYAAKNRWDLRYPIPCGDNAEEAYENFCRVAKFDPKTMYSV